MVHVLCTTTAIGLRDRAGRRCEAEAQKLITTEFTVQIIYVHESFGTPQERPTQSCVQDETELPRVRPDEPINCQLFSSSPGNTRKHCDGTVTTTAPKIDFEVHKRCPPCGHGIAVQIMAEKAEAGFRPTSRAMQKLNFRSSTNICGYFSVDSFWSIHEFVASEFGQLIVKNKHTEKWY